MCSQARFCTTSGKIEELSYNRSFGYSSEGQLLGHIVIGLKILADKIREVPDFPPRLRTLVEHLVISHHGELEFGSPKVPIFAEALLLHHLDNMDSKMEAVRSTLRKPSPVEADFTGWVPSLERVLLRKELFLNGPPAPEPAKQATPEQQPLPVEFDHPPVPESPAAASAPQSAPHTTAPHSNGKILTNCPVCRLGLRRIDHRRRLGTKPSAVLLRPLCSARNCKRYSALASSCQVVT